MLDSFFLYRGHVSNASMAYKYVSIIDFENVFKRLWAKNVSATLGEEFTNWPLTTKN